MPEMPDKVERNSSKLNLEAQRLSASEAIIPKESYKTIPEDIDHQHKVDVEGLENGLCDLLSHCVFCMGIIIFSIFHFLTYFISNFQSLPIFAIFFTTSMPTMCLSS